MPTIANTDWHAASPLAAGTYHFGLGGDASLVQAAQFLWDASLVGSITIWTCIYPIGRVALESVVAGQWIQQQPTSRYVAISPAGACTENNLTMTIPGGTAGGCDLELGNFGTHRVKAIVVVSTPGAFTYGFGGKS